MNSLIDRGRPVPAFEVAYGVQAQIVQEWQVTVETHTKTVHHANMMQPHDLVPVQADEIHVKTRVGMLWMAMAIIISTRLYLGDTVNAYWDRNLIGRLVAIIVAWPT